MSLPRLELGAILTHFQNKSGLGIIGHGETLEQSFTDAAHNMFSLMANLTNVHLLQIVTFEFEEEDPKQALVIWLNSLLTKAREHHLLFGDFRLKREGNKWFANASGEPCEVLALPGVAIKHALDKYLSIDKNNHLWEVRCVVNV